MNKIASAGFAISSAAFFNVSLSVQPLWQVADEAGRKVLLAPFAGGIIAGILFLMLSAAHWAIGIRRDAP